MFFKGYWKANRTTDYTIWIIDTLSLLSQIHTVRFYEPEILVCLRDLFISHDFEFIESRFKGRFKDNSKDSLKDT